MSQSDLNWIANFIWSIADDVLRDVYVRGKYRDVILPMTVIRRLDVVIEPTKQHVLDEKKRLDDIGLTHQDAALKRASGHAFYNTSPFTLRDLKSRAKQQQLKADFEAYLDGFSPDVQEILDKFKFRNQIPTLVEADVLGFLIEKFLDPSINLSPEPVYDREGNVVLPGLDNHAMGTIFEELIRRFNEENNEEAGEHFTPRDVIELMANLIFLPIADQIQSGTYVVYDGACGTVGMLTIADRILTQLAEEHGKEIAIHLYGQEVNPETYAIAKADLLIKGQGEQAENIAFGSTLSQDAFPATDFDFMLSNPPYGKSWKADIKRMGGKSRITDPRFIVKHAGNPEFSLLTRSNDGQMMFLANKVSKMKHDTPLGSRIAEVHNGSPLFTVERPLRLSVDLGQTARARLPRERRRRTGRPGRRPRRRLGPWPAPRLQRLHPHRREQETDGLLEHILGGTHFPKCVPPNHPPRDSSMPVSVRETAGRHGCPHGKRPPLGNTPEQRRGPPACPRVLQSTPDNSSRANP